MSDVGLRIYYFHSLIYNMTRVPSFFIKSTEHLRWRNFSWKRMCVISIALFIFLISWRLLFLDDSAKELTLPRLIRHIIVAMFMGFFSAFSKPEEKE
ncbi:hypothetical protein KACHI17_02510 [Sediminibacterium sp. KACHI17]|uniref:Uncharacterized protein n=1 Tax=Sediminibacterium sp. KACHI17 TaxID=1751071 RepID=A0AAT9GFG8_9BACT